MFWNKRICNILCEVLNLADALADASAKNPRFFDVPPKKYHHKVEEYTTPNE